MKNKIETAHMLMKGSNLSQLGFAAITQNKASSRTQFLQGKTLGVLYIITAAQKKLFGLRVQKKTQST